jgi:hypothetical protein
LALQPESIWSEAGDRNFLPRKAEKLTRHRLHAGRTATAEALSCWTLAFMIWLLPMLSPPLIFPVARIAPLFPVVLIVLLLRPGVSASAHGR